MVKVLDLNERGGGGNEGVSVGSRTVMEARPKNGMGDLELVEGIFKA